MPGLRRQPLHPLDSLLELPPNARISPEFESEIVWLAAGGPCQRAADVAAFTGSSRITRNAVMGCMRRAGRACERDDARRERSLWKDGVLPGGGLLLKSTPDLPIWARFLRQPGQYRSTSTGNGISRNRCLHPPSRGCLQAGPWSCRTFR
jgi:hypothetical protein